MKVILCEKSSAANDIAKGLSKKLGSKATKSREGFIQVGDFQIVWAAGHLIEMNVEESFGDRSKYPVFPSNWKYQAASGNDDYAKSKRKLLKTAVQQLKAASEIIIATDCGREGELIGRLIINHAKVSKTPLKRFWTSEALEAEVVANVFDNLASGADYDSLYQEALARQHADAYVGINLSRALKDISGAGGGVSVGRVQSPVLSVLVQREDQILNFKPEKFWTLQAEFGDSSNTYLGKWKRAQAQSKKSEFGSAYRLTEDEATQLTSKLATATTGTILNVATHKKVEKPPLLHSITSMQILMNKRYGLSAEETDKALQSLYDRHKVSSYPRTESKHLGDNNVQYIKDILVQIGRTDLVSKVSGSNKRVFDSSKLTDHHALIPTRNADLSKFNHAEKLVYTELVNSLTAAFYPDAISETFTITTEVVGECFESKGTCDLQAGWKEVFNTKLKKFSFELKKGTEVSVMKLNKAEQWTKPPARFTEATLLEIMENAHLLIPKEMRAEREIMKTKENAGLGTGATRSGIIRSLLSEKKGYATMLGTGKTKYIVPSKRGMALIHSLPTNSRVTNALLTAELEQQLKEIRQKTLTKEQFLKTLQTSIIDETAAFRTANFKDLVDTSSSFTSASATKLSTSCPECKSSMLDIKAGVKCSECDFIVWKKFLGRKLTTAQIQKMLIGKEIVMRNLKAKTGKIFDSYVKYDVINKRFSCDFGKSVPSKSSKTTKATKTQSISQKKKTTSTTSSYRPKDLPKRRL